MKKLACVLSLVLVFGMAAVGVAGELTKMAEKSPLKAEAVSITDAANSVEMTGTILKDNTFVDESGQSYQLGDSETNKLLQSMIGEKIKINATVMEKSEDLKSIFVTSYEVIK